MRISRRLRGLLAAAVTTGALLALPGAAFAVPVTTTVTKDASTPSIEPGAVVKYNVELDTAAPTAGGGVITVRGFNTSFHGQAGTVAGGTVTSEAAATNDLILAGFVIADGVTAGTRTITVPANFDTGDKVTVSFDVTLPATRVVPAAFRVEANGALPLHADFDAGTSSFSTSSEIYKGDGSKTSKLYVTAGETTSNPGGLGNWWAPLNSSATTTFTVHNWGDGSAYDVQIWSSAGAETSPIQPAKPKADSPDYGFLTDLDVKTSAVGGDCGDVPSTETASDCVIGEIPAGGSKTVTVTTSGLTHLGMTISTSVSPHYYQGLERNRQHGSPGWNDGDDWNSEVYAASVKIADGKTVLPRVDLDGPTHAASRSDVTYKIEIANGGPDAITNGVLRVSGPVYDDKGNPAGSAYVGDEKRSASLKSVDIPGVTCGESKNEAYENHTTGKFETKTRLSVADCSIADLPSGARLTGTIVANFPTGHKDSTVAGSAQSVGNYEDGSVSAKLYTGHFDKPGSGTTGSATTRLNRTSFADLDVSVKSAAVIGADRLGLHTVTIKNNGPSTAKNVSFSGSLYKLVGKFEPTLLPGRCTGVVVSSIVRCAIGDIESGKTATIAIPLLGAKKLGTIQVATYSVGSEEFDPNNDNNSVAHVQTVVKAALAPLTGVKVVKAPAVLRTGVLARTGLKSTVTVPGTSVVTVDLRVARVTAVKLGLIKAGKVTKKTPVFVKIGTGKKVMKKNGKTIVVTKLNRAYKAKVLKLRKPLKAQRVVTVVSTAKLTRGATSLTTSNLTIRK